MTTPTPTTARTTARLGGYPAVLRIDLRDITHTWRIAVVPGLLLLNAIASPVLAHLTPQLMASTLGPAAPHLPDPTMWDAYAQWTKNLTPLTLLAVIVTTSGAINTDITTGTAALTLTTPVTRTAYTLAKYTANALLLTLTTTLATLVTWATTLLVFGNAEPAPLIKATTTWLLLALAYTAATHALSAALPSPLAATGAGLATLIIVSILATWPAAAHHSPAGMTDLITHLGHAQTPPWQWPITTTALTIPLLLATTTTTLNHRDL